MDEEILKRQCGDWRLEREIGQGAYGTVYLAVGPGGERVAVKVCRRDAVGEERYERELRGAKLYRAIPPQEGLVRMRDLVETEWGFYTVMDLADDEFASGSAASSGRAASPFAAASGVYRPKTLARVIEGEKALPLKESVSLALSLAKGLATLQRHHLLHRDIKPANVLYVKGRPVLSDPGLIVEESKAVSLVGTPGYVPPEKFTEAASDIYSLGLTLKAASFGRQVEDLDKGPALEADTGAPLFPAWWRILNKATDPTPSRRYQSAKALIKDIKVLRVKMTVASTGWMNILKIVVGGIFLYVATNTILSIIERRRVINETLQDARRAGEEHVRLLNEELYEMRSRESDQERKDRDSFWEKYTSFSHNLKDDVSETLRKVEKVKRFADSIRRDISEIKMVDALKAEKLESCLEKVIELGVKEVLLLRRLEELHTKAREKLGKGIDDKNEYLQAKTISKELDELDKSVKNSVYELTRDRRHFIYAVRNKWDSYFMGRSHDVNEHLLKKDIEKIAVIDKVKAEELKSLLDKMTRLYAEFKSLDNAWRVLRDKGKKKAKDGLDDMAEFRQAVKINEEQCRLFDNEIKPLADELKSKWDRYREDFIDEDR